MMIHRFVKSTPNPSATKKRRGDWELLLERGALVAVAVGSNEGMTVLVASDIASASCYVCVLENAERYSVPR
jgi:hypothetical protein